MEWFREHLWETWLGLAILLGVAELFSLDLILLMLALGAVVGMIAALAGLDGWLQVVAAGVAATAALALIRPSVARKLHRGPELVLGHSALIGRQATVTEEIAAGRPGRIHLAGETWSAEPYDEQLVIRPGQAVEVFEIRGATAVVHPLGPSEIEPGPA